MRKTQVIITLVLVAAVVSAGLIGTVSFAAPTETHGTISVAFDDCRQSQYDYAFPLMQARGMKATFYVITDYISDFSNDDSYLSIAELQTMQDYGCEIASYSKTHANFPDISDSQIREECSVSKQVLQSYGFSADNFAYPYGGRNDHTDSIVAEYYRSARSAYAPPYIMQLPVSQFLLPGCPGETGDPDVLPYLESVVDEVYSTNGWAIIFFHNIIPDANNIPFMISSQDFESFLDYVIYKGVATITVSQGLDLTSPPSPPPSVTISPTSVRLYVGQSQTFSSSVSGGNPPFSYQWCLNDSAVSGATDSTWTFTPRSAGHYKVCLNVTDGLNFRVQSNVVSDVLVWTAQTPAVENFTVIVLPDTQSYSASYPVIFDSQTRWIVSEAENMNVVFVTHEGDIVDSDILVQWQNANRSMSMLDDHVPWGILPGNHDGAFSGGSLANYDAFFGCARFSGESWYGGGYLGSNANNYEFFSGGGDDYLIFHFQYDPSDAVLAWANETIEGFPNRKVIVTTHDYLGISGDRSSVGENIWREFIEPHADQVFLVLCGHAEGEARRTDVVGGHVVYQLLADYNANGGNGFLRILKFSPAEDKIYVATYSPYLNSYDTDSDSEFELGFDMTGVFRGSSLLLTVMPNQASYMRGQSVTLTVNVFNQLNPSLESSLTLTVIGPSDYGYFDVQPVSVPAGTVGEYTFDWVVPNVAGTYVVEVELVPTQLTAYDAVWLDAA